MVIIFIIAFLENSFTRQPLHRPVNKIQTLLVNKIY